MGLLDGLGNLGLGHIDSSKIYEKKEDSKKSGATEVKKIEKPFDENEMIFDKSCTCPVCDKQFTYRAVRTGKARLLGLDDDLRPRYDKFDPLKYDVILCPYCGYGALTKFFESITSGQAKLIKKEISGKVRSVKNSGILSYDDALARHQLALASAMVKRGKDSEKAYVCLKMAWILRGKIETYPEDAPDYDDVIEMCRMDEEEALSRAFEGFVSARQSESFPIAGMDESTLDYLIAELAFKFKKLDIASKLVSQLLVKSSTNSRIKDKCRNLKERIQAEMKNNG